MARKVTVTLVDDVDDTQTADETVEFGLDGVTYEIDLNEEHAAALRALGARGELSNAVDWENVAEEIVKKVRGE